MLKKILLIGAGGALGSIFRYLITYASTLLAISSEWATLLVNVLGSFLVGMLITMSGNGVYLFAAVGFCGGFTTFSTFSAQTLQLLQSEQRILAIFYILASLTLSVMAVWAGLYCGNKFLK